MNATTTHILAFALGIALTVTWYSRPSQETPPAPPVAEQAVEKPAPVESPQPPPPPVVAAPTRSAASEPEDLETALQQDDLTRAAELVAQMRKTAPNAQETHEAYGRLLVRQGNYPAAREALRSCVRRFPGSLKCAEERAEVEFNTGNVGQQESAVMSCLELTPENPRCKELLARVRMNQEDFEEAIALYEELQKENLRSSRTLSQELLDLQMARSLEGAGRESDALSYYDKACRSNNTEACEKVEELRRAL